MDSSVGVSSSAPRGQAPPRRGDGQLFSPALFRALLEALDPSDVGIRIITTIALNNLGHARAIVDVIERRMYHVGLESLALRALWIVIDHLIKAAPLVYGRLLAPHIPTFVERRVAWDSDDALRISFWMQRLVSSWKGLLPLEVWKNLHDSVRQKRTRMLLDYTEGQAGQSGEGSAENLADLGEEEAQRSVGTQRVRTATQRQLESLQMSWNELLKTSAVACGQESNNEEGSAKRRRTESAADDVSKANRDQREEGAAGAGAGDDEDDADFDIGVVDPNAIVLDANGNPIMALQEIQLPVAARQPRRRR